jgi:phenylpropionate dioxygenase-like ring-hydroxylating dioxygenase large terminal subunit
MRTPGWFAAATTSRLALDPVLPVRMFASELVLFRTATGELRLLDGHCPHLGAHLGHGGCVEGDSIRCPFHGWRWGGDGSCQEIPYAKKIPPRAQLRSYPVAERSGLVWAWLDDSPPAEPPGDLPASSWPLDRLLDVPVAELLTALGSTATPTRSVVVAHDQLYAAVTPVDPTRTQLRAGARSPEVLTRLATRLDDWEVARCASR